MTTMTMNSSVPFYSNARLTKTRAPKLSFAARLAAIQARHEQTEPVSGIAGVAIRASLAAVPFAALTWVFFAV